MTSTKLAFLLALSLFLSNAHAEDAKPTEESIKQLFVLTNAKSLIRSVDQQIDNLMKSSMEQALKGAKPSEKEQVALDKFRAKIVVVYKEEISWEKLEPIFIKIYTDSLTQEEVDGITAFYQSPSGQAMIKKMPVIIQNTMGSMQKIMVPMMEKLQVASKELAQDMEKIKKK
ncbi:DUF2059 domain-containing protein [Undibacterium sp. Rencai35W]|uniref:DUF2059 domain-containing protein n=1 Tax=Undibacterium sp. Rencai35W TaxID=3413046 RepID=UPI003BF1748F